MIRNKNVKKRVAATLITLFLLGSLVAMMPMAALADETNSYSTSADTSNVHITLDVQPASTFTVTADALPTDEADGLTSAADSFSESIPNDPTLNLDPAVTQSATASWDVAVQTNADSYTVSLAEDQQPTKTNAEYPPGEQTAMTIKNVTGTNASPAAFPAVGTAGVGYSLSGLTTISGQNSTSATLPTGFVDEAHSAGDPALFAGFITGDGDTIMSNASPTGNDGDKVTVGYKAQVDWTINAGTYKQELTFTYTPVFTLD